MTQRSLCKGGKKIARARSSRWLPGNSAFWTQQASCMGAFTTVETTRTRTVKAQARQKASMDTGSRYKVPPVAKILLAIGSCWERGNLLSLRVCIRVKKKKKKKERTNSHTYPSGHALTSSSSNRPLELALIYLGGSMLFPSAFWPRQSASCSNRAPYQAALPSLTALLAVFHHTRHTHPNSVVGLACPATICSFELN